MHEARKLFEDIIVIPQEFDKFVTAARPVDIDWHLIRQRLQ